MFSGFNKYLSMKWYALQGGPNDFLLATSQLLIQIKMILTYTRKYCIFTAIENYLNSRYLNETYPEANRSTYLSFEIPLRVALRLVIVPRGPEPTSKVIFKRHMGNIRFQPP